MPEQWEILEVDGQSMSTFTAAPESPRPLPAMVVIMHAGGVDTFVQETTRRMAAAGYFGIAPELFHREDPNSGEDMESRRRKRKDPEYIADVDTAVDFLRSHRAVDSNRIGIMGFCFGGRIAYMMATVNPAFKAAVAFYGSRTMVQWGDAPTPFERLANTYCPILGFFGEEDPNPSPEDMQKLDAELTRHSKPHEFHSYAGAGHAYMDFTNPRSYRPNAAEASWPLTLDFLERHLGAVSAAR